LEIFEMERTLGKVNHLSGILAQRLEECKGLDHVGDVRQKGLVAGIELVKEKETREPYPPELTMGYRVIYRAREEGVVIRPLGNVVVVIPPFCFTDEELNRLMDVIISSIKNVTDELSD
jgi:adenosylmethionine-8-amino-7-oxononanoate aminotransferase